METTFLDLRCKEVVNVLDGRRLGHITDIVFDLSSARVIGFILPADKTGWNIFKPCEPLFVPYCCIKRIGEDTILIELSSQCNPTNPYVLGNK